MAIDKNIDVKKKEASDWFRSLRDDFCKTFEDLKSKGKSLEEASMDEISDLIKKNTPDS